VGSAEPRWKRPALKQLLEGNFRKPTKVDCVVVYKGRPVKPIVTHFAACLSVFVLARNFRIRDAGFLRLGRKLTLGISFYRSPSLNGRSSASEDARQDLSGAEEGRMGGAFRCWAMTSLRRRAPQ